MNFREQYLKFQTATKLEDFFQNLSSLVYTENWNREKLLPMRFGNYDISYKY